MLYNVHYSIAGLLFLIVYFVFLKIQYQSDSKDNARFFLMILAVFVADFFDIITAYSISYSQSCPIWLNYCLNTFYYIFSVVCVYCFPNYVRALIYDKEFKIGDIINLVMLILYIFVCFINLSTGIIFSFSENGEYIHGPGYYFVYCVTIYYMVYAFVRMIYCRSRFSKKQLYSILIFIVSSQVGTVLQVFLFPHVLLTYFTPALMAFVILIAFETPDYQKLIKMADELEESRSELEKARKREEERTRLLHELMGTASWELYFDEEGNVTLASWSPEFKHMLGYSDDYKCNDSELWVNSLHPDDRNNAITAFYNGMNYGISYNYEFRLIDKYGKAKWYRGSGESVYDKDNHLTSYKGIIRDIDHEKTTSQLAQEKLEALEDLKESQKALTVALEEAKSANKAKSTFLTNMSHDIRTPMNAIIGFTELAIENAEDKSQVVECLDKIKTSGNHLVSLINDILDMNRIESGKVILEPKTNELKSLIHDVYSIVQSGIESGKLNYIEKLDGIKSKYILCDGLRLNQVLLNCIGNSVKFTPKNGSITIEVNESEINEKTHNFEFIISDTGIGMSKEFLSKVFEPFERERTSTISKTQGTGLGMSITKAIVEMMNGSIRIESQEGEGTRYIFTLPFDIVTEDEYNALNVQLENEKDDMDMMLDAIKGLHCLIVDDNAVNRILAKKILNTRGITNEEAQDGRAACDIINNSTSNYFDVVFMDIQMPVMNGYEAADEIRSMKNSAHANIPIIAMTADAFEEDKERCLEHGMNAHISKPIIVEDLISTIYNVVIKPKLEGSSK